MAYLTYYNLSIHSGTGHGDEKFIDSVKDALRNLTDHPEMFSERDTWYSHEEDMRNISSHYPDTVFLLAGKGDDDDDFWREYYKAGEMQRCEAEIVYPPFDPVLLS